MQRLVVGGAVAHEEQLLGVSLQDALLVSCVAISTGESVLQGGHPQGGEVAPAHQESPEAKVQFGDDGPVRDAVSARSARARAFRISWTPRSSSGAAANQSCTPRLAAQARISLSRALRRSTSTMAVRDSAAAATSMFHS